MNRRGDNDPKIAGDLRCSDWQRRERELIETGGRELWLKTYQKYFNTRLETRYFKPIGEVAKNTELSGEGFSVMAILCTLVEFLEATRQGKEYRYLSREEKRAGIALGSYEYDTSREYFKNLLRTQPPFDEYFDTEDKAQDFYKSIRCGLLHEAQTKNGWKIRHLSPVKAIDFDQKIVYWHNFRLLIDQYLENYSDELASDQILQEAFTRKYNSLCR